MLNSYYKNSEPTSTEFGLIVRLVTPTTAVPVSGTVTTNAPIVSTATKSSVGDAASDTQILAANANRKGAVIANDSSANLYLSLGSVAASTTSYTVLLQQNDVYVIGEGHTYEVRGIWASDAGGAARVTEFTA